jgi:hypothetical protein
MCGCVGRSVRAAAGSYPAPSGVARAGSERLVALMPAARDALPEGDFRDWPEIEAWAAEIARALRPSPAG